MKTCFYKEVKYQNHPCTGEKCLVLYTLPGVCTLNCDQCDIRGCDRVDTLNDEELDLLLESAKYAYQIEAVCISGGEPTSFAIFLARIINQIKETYNLKVYIKTNGTLPNQLQHLVDIVDGWIVRLKLPPKECLSPNRYDAYTYILMQETESTLIVDKYVDLLKQTLETLKNYNLCIQIQKHPNLTEEEVQCMIRYAKQFTENVVLEDQSNGNILPV